LDRYAAQRQNPLGRPVNEYADVRLGTGLLPLTNLRVAFASPGFGCSLTWPEVYSVNYDWVRRVANPGQPVSADVPL
jgi:hypothetical protein